MVVPGALGSIFFTGELPTAAREPSWDVDDIKLRRPSTSALVGCDEPPKGERPPTPNQGRRNSANLGRRSQLLDVAIPLVSLCPRRGLRRKGRNHLGDERLGQYIVTSTADTEPIVVAIHAP